MGIDDRQTRRGYAQSTGGPTIAERPRDALRQLVAVNCCRDVRRIAFKRLTAYNK